MQKIYTIKMPWLSAAEMTLFWPVVQWVEETTEGQQWLALIRELDATGACDPQDSRLMPYPDRDNPDDTYMETYAVGAALTASNEIWLEIGQAICWRFYGVQRNPVAVRGLHRRLIVYIRERLTDHD